MGGLEKSTGGWKTRGGPAKKTGRELAAIIVGNLQK